MLGSCSALFVLLPFLAFGVDFSTICVPCLSPASSVKMRRPMGSDFSAIPNLLAKALASEFDRSLRRVSHVDSFAHMIAEGLETGPGALPRTSISWRQPRFFGFCGLWLRMDPAGSLSSWILRLLSMLVLRAGALHSASCRSFGRYALSASWRVSILPFTTCRPVSTQPIAPPGI